MAAALVERIVDLAVREGLEHDRVAEDRVVLVMPGTARLRTVVSLRVGAQALTLNAFVCRRPDENHAEVHQWLLRRNASMFAMAFALDRLGDIYLVGRVPVGGLSDDDLDRLLGSVLQYADESFNVLLAMGFTSAIRREHAWRVSRGESLANLAAFAALVDEEETPAGGSGPA